MLARDTTVPPEDPIRKAWRATRPLWVHVCLFSGIVNLLMLTGSIYMLQVYDRVLSSRSVPTLVALSLLALAAFLLQGVVDAMRHRLLGRIGAVFDAELSPIAARGLVTMPLLGAKPQESAQPLRDLDSVRSFLASMGPTALIDMPFMPLFLAACFLLHPWLGWLAVFGALLIIGLTLYTERVSKAPSAEMSRSAAIQGLIVESGRRNAEAIAGLGMSRTFADQFDRVHRQHVGDTLVLTENTAFIAAMARVVRMVLQSAVLGLGAYLAINGQVSPGAMIASSILTTRALAPIEVAVAHWKGFVAARQGLARLRHILPRIGSIQKSMSLPTPSQSLRVEELVVVAPGTQRPILQGVTFSLSAGQALGLIGPSGSGKSTLARALVGAWQPVRGAIRFDGALASQWDPDDLGRALGYLPQDIELFDGTIAENIARFHPAATSEEILKAAQDAGADELIRALPQGYETRVGEGGAKLSGGQRQRIALARALYGVPFLLVLDEPNANLDSSGDEALARAVQAVKQRGGVVVIITHRPAGLSRVDLVGALADGKIVAFGPREQVLHQMMKQGGLPAVHRPQFAAGGAAPQSPRSAK
jgi:ATP-binding cassette, subfamily C, bacterial PrsD